MVSDHFVNCAQYGHSFVIISKFPLKSQPPSDRKSAPCLETPRTGSPTGGKRKKRMRKGRPQEDGAPAPSPFIIPPTDLSLLIYTANSSPAVVRLSLLHRTAVPAQRGGRSGATASPFRRNGITVPARRHHRSGATGWASRRNGITVPAQRRPPSRPRRQNGGARHRRTRPARRGNLNENVRIVAKRTREIFSEASHHACILPRLRQKKCAAHRPIAMKAAL